MNNKLYLLALNKISTLGPIKIKKILQVWPQLSELFNLSQDQMQKSGLPEAIASQIAAFNLNNLEEDLRWEQENNNHILTIESELYPPLLKEIHDPPIILYAKGQLSALNKTSIAIVGTRKPSFTGAETAKHFAKKLSEQDLCIVSGLALGIDAEAHKGCLESKGTTIAVLGTGLECIYPRRHLELSKKITEKGLILSEFPLKSPAIPLHFPRRNRIISGLSLATLIIEAAVKSGSLITARFALEQNRDVLAIPGSIHNPQSRGCHYLLQQGAKLVTSVEDVLETLEIMQSPCLQKEKSPVNKGDLIDCIGFETTTIDQLLLRSQKDIENLTSALANLEIQGFIKTVPGGYIKVSDYER